MNIFVLDEDPIVAATYHFDDHVRKMIIESAQMLCMPHNMESVPVALGGKQIAPYKSGLPRVTKTGKITLGAYVNHPCSKWARDNISNYRWLLQLGLSLCDEFEFRFRKNHATKQVLLWLTNNEPNLPNKSLSTFTQCITSGIRCESAIKAYRLCYQRDKRHLACWTRRGKPYWYK